MKEETLNRLRDIKLPHEIGLWPFAYGWYLLFILGLLALTCLLVWRYRVYLRNRPKQIALQELNKIKQAYLQEKNTPKTATALTSLLKRFCLTYCQRHKIAPLHGDALEAFLGNTEWSSLLTTLSYQKTSDKDLTPYFDSIAKWIKGKHHV